MVIDEALLDLLLQRESPELAHREIVLTVANRAAYWGTSVMAMGRRVIADGSRTATEGLSGDPGNGAYCGIVAHRSFSYGGVPLAFTSTRHCERVLPIFIDRGAPIRSTTYDMAA